MIEYKSDKEIELIRESSLLVAKTLGEVAKVIRPGIKTIELDKLAEEFILDHGAKPGFKGYHGFSGTLCISPNEQVVHGIPGERELKEGDIVSVDCGVLKNGFYGDCAYSFAIGEIEESVRRLLNVTHECLLLGIEQAVEGNTLGDIHLPSRITLKKQDTQWCENWLAMVWAETFTNRLRYLILARKAKG